MGSEKNQVINIQEYIIERFLGIDDHEFTFVQC